jgi:hypothetical protein
MTNTNQGPSVFKNNLTPRFYNRKEKSYSIYYVKTKKTVTKEEFDKRFRDVMKNKTVRSHTGGEDPDIKTGFMTRNDKVTFTNGDEFNFVITNTSFDVYNKKQCLEFSDSGKGGTLTYVIEEKEHLTFKKFDELRGSYEKEFEGNGIFSRYIRVNTYGYHRKDGSVVPSVFRLIFPNDIELKEVYYSKSPEDMKKHNPQVRYLESIRK